MLLKINDRSHHLTIDGIVLQEGWIPSVDTGGLSPDDRKSLCIPQIQSVEWYKTLILESLTIDCEHYKLSWSVSARKITDTVPQSRVPAQRDRECIRKELVLGHETELCSVDGTQEDLYHVFESVKESLFEYDETENRVQLYESILQILHYFLQEVVLNEFDREILQSALVKQTELVQTQDQKIDREVDEMRLLKHRLRNIQTVIVKNINSVYSGKVPKKNVKKILVSSIFLQQLSDDLEHDARKNAFHRMTAEISKEVNIRQRKAGSLILQPHAITQTLETETAEAVNTSDHMVIRTYEATDLAREIVHELLRGKKGSTKFIKFKVPERKRVEIQDVVLEYMEKTQQLKNMKKQVELLVTAKAQMLGVKMELQAFLGLLDEGKRLEVEHKGLSSLQKSIHMSEHSQNLSKQLAKMLEDKTSDIHAKHVAFVVSILCQCDIICERLTNHSLEGIVKLIGASNVSEIQKPNPSNVETIMRQDEEHCVLDYIKNMNDVIVSHVTRVSEDLQSEAAIEPTDQGKVRQYYERMLFREIGEVVEKTHTLACSKQTTIIKSHIGEMTAELLDLTSTSVSCLLCEQNEDVTKTISGDVKECLHFDAGNSHSSDSNIQCTEGREKLHDKKVMTSRDTVDEIGWCPTQSHKNVEISEKTSQNNLQLLRKYHSTPDDREARQLKHINRQASITGSRKTRHFSETKECRNNSSEGLFPSLPTCKELETAKDYSPHAKQTSMRNRISKYKNVDNLEKGDLLSGACADYQYGKLKFKARQFSMKCAPDDIRRSKSKPDFHSSHRQETIKENDITLYSSSSGSEIDSDEELILIYAELPGETEQHLNEVFQGASPISDPEGLPSAASPRKASDMAAVCHCTLSLQAKYYEELQPVFSLLQELCNQSAPADKLEKGVQVSQMLGKIGSRLLGKKHVESDTLNDLLVVVLCNVGVDMAASLYVNVEMMRGFLPESDATNHYGFMVTSWEIVWRYLLSKMKKLERNVSIA